ncbi:MAG: hypothetical protein ACRECV_13500 [Xanthobacteraceae bacterium]
MFWIMRGLSWRMWPRLALLRQLGAVWDEICKTNGPADGVGALAASTIVVINPCHFDNWQGQIPDEAIKRFGHPRGWIKVIADEPDIQSRFYRLDHRELAAYRQGIPIIKKIVPFRRRPDLAIGSRKLDEAEHRLRRALGYQVYIRTEQARALIESSQSNRTQLTVPEARRAIWKRLAHYVGFDRRADLPRLKLRARPGDKKLTREERSEVRRERTFGALFNEGVKLAVACVAGAEVPRQVGLIAIASGSGAAAASNFERDLEAMLMQVVVLYRASVVLGRKVSFLYRFWSWVGGGIPARRKSRRGAMRSRQMRAGQHQVLATGSFRPAELLLVACHADIDPLSLDPRHFGCAREFEIARKLGRFHRGSNERLCLAEVETLRDALTPREGSGHSEYEAMQGDLRSIALETFGSQEWHEILSEAAMRGEGITLTHTRR